ncbi:MAG: 5-methylcytosine-specific restriction endonuclease system specificity protein McrC [Pseudomonadota bacterium]
MSSESGAIHSIDEDDEEIPDLVAEILANAVEQRLHRNLSYGYQIRNDELRRVRGRIDIFSTERHQLLARGKIACQFEELTIDTARNRFVLAALEMVSKVVTRSNLAHRCRTLANSLKRLGVIGARPTRAEMSIDRLGRNDAQDRTMLAAAKLAFEMELPSEEEGDSSLYAPARDEVWVRRLFERAVGGFYSAVLSNQGWKVNPGKVLRWQISNQTSGIDSILPSMRTDIVLDQSEQQRRLVIDTKFNSIVTAGWYREESLRSGYVYQMYAYLMSQAGSDDIFDQHSSGLLLHPSIGKEVDEVVVIQDRQIRFATVDLAAPVYEIRRRLLEVVK